LLFLPRSLTGLEKLMKTNLQIARLTVVIALAISILTVARGVEAQPVVAYWLIPHESTFKSFADFAQDLELEDSLNTWQPVTQIEFEVRDCARHLRLARLPYFDQLDRRVNDKHPIKGLEYGVNDHFDQGDLWQLAGAAPGNYQIALLVNGVRASNVVQITIDPAFDVKKQPVLQLGMIEAPPLYPHGWPVAWIVSPTPMDDKFTRQAVAMPAIRSDGVSSTRPFFPWHTARGPVPCGLSIASVLRCDGYSPTINVSLPHEYQVVIGRYASGKVRLDLGERPLGKTWDEATPTMRDVPRPSPILEGNVIDADGKPYAGMIVNVGSEGAARAMTDVNGHYALSNIPAGEYSLSCRSPYGYPTWGQATEFKLPADQTTTYNISFKSKYYIAGRIFQGGHGVAGIKMNVYWRRAGPNNLNCVTQAVSDADGRYQSRGPYEIIDGVGFNYDGKVKNPPPNRQDVTPGMKNVDFTLPSP
jgi:hypothetical protein